MKTTMDLPDDLVRELKLRAVLQGRTLRDLVAEYLMQGLGLTVPKSQQFPPGESKVEIGLEGLPFVRCQADAPAMRMSPKALLDLEQQTQTSEDVYRAGLPY